MAIETELPQGQITPAARPIEAFIQPAQTNIAQPNRPSQLGDPGGMRMVQTGGTFNVGGENKFARLANDLQAFNPELVKGMQAAGLMYAESQIKEGEKRARNQVLHAMAQNDSSMESDELKRAAMNRALAAKDPQAGGFMAMLNPYAAIGWERGKSKLAAQEAQIGLPTYVAQNASKIDYTAADQGFGALAKLQAEYTAQLSQKYGIDASSPGFQKYTLPEIEKAQEKVQTKHLADRKEYFDTVGVQQTSAQVRQMYLTTEASGVVEVNGQTFARSADPTRFRQMQQFKAQSIIEGLLLRQSMPGEAGKRSEAVYQELAKLSDYTLDDNFNKFIDSLPSQQVLKDENGKAVVNPATGRPFSLTWGEVYRGTAIDSEMKYEEAAAQRRRRQQERALEGGQEQGGFEDGLYAAIQGIPPGPQQQAAADAFTEQWYRERGQALGISRSELAKRRSQLVKLDDNIYSEGSDPTAGSSFFAQLNESYGSSFNATQQRQRMLDAASRIKDPEKKESFIKEASSAIASREKEIQNFSGYARARDEVLDQAIKSNLASYYDMTALSDDPRARANVEASKTRQMSAFVPRANDLIAKEEAHQKRRLSETEVRKIARAAVFGDPDLGIKPYGSGDGAAGSSGQNQKEYLFPGSRKTDEPTAPTPGRPRPAGRTYELYQLNTIQDRRALRQYKAAAVLTPDAALQAWRMVQRGDIPPALNRAYRDAGASSAAEFALGQLDVHRRLLSQKGVSGAALEKFNPPADVRARVLRDSTRAAAGGSTVESVASNAPRTPLLAQLGGSVLNALTGAAPATAGTLDSAPRQYGGGRPQPGNQSAPPPRVSSASVAPTPRRSGSTDVPPAPVLPAPSGGVRGPEVATASPAPSVMGEGVRTPVGQVRPAGPSGWVIDEAGNYFSPTEGRPTVEDPVTNQRPRLRAMRFDSTPYMQGGNSGTTAPADLRSFEPVLALLRSGEGSWDSANRGTAGDTPGGVRGLSRMTLGQWKGLQSQGYNALGAYQFIPRTLQLAAREAGISDSTVMTPEVQGRLAVQLMVGSKRPRLSDYMNGKSNNLNAALDDLALEWASVHTARGGTAYQGIGGNAASIPRSRAAQVLQQARAARLGGASAEVPAGWTSSRSGVRNGSSFGNQESFRRHPHEGADLGFDAGTQLAFSVGGTVVRVGRTNSRDREANGGYGNFVDVRLSNGQVARLAHLSSIPAGISEGRSFNAGQTVALSGGAEGSPGAGRSGGAHLHLEEHDSAMGLGETTRGKRNPSRRGGVMDYLIWRRG